MTAIAAYAFAGDPPVMVLIPCPFCDQSTYTPESPWIRREIETLGCGWCEQSVKGGVRQDYIGEINELPLSAVSNTKEGI